LNKQIVECDVSHFMYVVSKLRKV